MTDSLKEAFLHPLDEFTPIPFWFWNNGLDEKEITRQIEDFHSKGICGFVIHPRMGLPEDIPYLSDRFMHYVKYAVSKAARLNMKIVLYDEAMYPSGSAHGMVVQDNPEFASRCICMKEYQEFNVSPDLAEGDAILCALAVQKDSDGKILPETIQELEVKDGTIHFTPPEAPESRIGINPVCSAYSILVFAEGFSRGTIRGIHFGEDDKENSAPASGDLLNPDAMDKFVRITYDRYYEVLKEYFGATVIAMFTDEPDELGRCHRPGCMPWTIGFMDWWSQYGGSKKDLPFLWLDGANSAAVRRRFRKAVNQRLKYSYYSTDGTIRIQKQSYSVLVVENPQLLDKELLQTLAPFLNNGGNLVVYQAGDYGHGTQDYESGMQDYGPGTVFNGVLPDSNCCRPDDALAAASQNISVISRCEDIIAALDACCCREIRMTPACPDLRVSHVMKEGRGFYVLVNEGEQCIGGRIHIPAAGSTELWDAWNGTCMPVQAEADPDADWMEIPFSLERRESLIVSVEKKETGSSSQANMTPAASYILGAAPLLTVPDCYRTNIPLLNLKWRITSAIQDQAIMDAGLSSNCLSGFACCNHTDMPAGSGCSRSDTPVCSDCISSDMSSGSGCNNAYSSTLTSWTQWQGMENFSGTVTYEAEFSSGAAPETSHWFLDLGEVYETVHIKVNGRNAGFRLWGPYRFDITPYVNSGSNLICLEITNTLANGMSGAKLPSGLLGPVKLFHIPMATA